MATLIQILVSTAFIIGTIQTACTNTPVEIGQMAWKTSFPTAGRVFILILLLPAIALSLIARSGKKLFVWSLFKLEETLGEKVAPDDAQATSES